MKQYVFVYGTLKSGFGNHGVLGGSEFIGKARTISDHYSMINGGFPWTITKGHFFIKGEVYLVTNEQVMRNLDHLEGVPHLFDHHHTNVITDDGEVYDVVMYVASNRNADDLLKTRQQVVPDDNNICEWGNINAWNY